MKKQGLIYILVVILAFGLLAQQTSVNKKLTQLYKRGKLGEALKIINQEMKKGKVPTAWIQMKYNIHLQLGEYEKALNVVEIQIKKQGEKQELLAAKSNVLIRLKKFQKALTTALKKDKLARIKSPWDGINIANLYLRLENKVEALNWLDEAVKRGFIDYRLFDQNSYRSIVTDKKLLSLITEIKLIIGLGQKARDFTVRLINGESFTLSQQKGKVILVYFWATWCKPCTREITFLRKEYAKLQTYGFEIIGINIDTSKARLLAYLKKAPLPWKTYWTGREWQDDTVKLYGVNSLPSIWLVGRRGDIRSFGLRQKEMVKAIQVLLKEK